MIRVLIVDDHAVVRHGLKQILNDCDDLGVAGEADNGVEAIQWLRRYGQGCQAVLLDIAMPKRSGLDTLTQIRNEFPRLPVLVLSMYPEDVVGLRVLKAGAAGYVSKQSAPELLVEAIRQVASGRKYVSPTLAEQLADSIASNAQEAPHERLSNREYQILCLIASGKGLTQIAEELNISVKTVSAYRARLLEKMRLKNNAELIRYAISKGLVE